MRKPLIFLLSIASLPLAGCSSSDEKENSPTANFLESIPIVYRQDIQQGNIINQEMINKLEPGMSKSQVEFLLGTPAVVDVYRPDQWHYILFRKTGDDETVFKRRMTLTFTNGLLTKIEGSLNPI